MEVLHVTIEAELRQAGIDGEGLNLDAISAQKEISLCSPGERAIVLDAAVNFSSEMDAS